MTVVVQNILTNALLTDVIGFQSCQNLVCAHDHRARNTGQMGNMNAKALISSAPLNLSQEDHVLAVFLDADAVVDNAGKAAFQLAEFVIMRGKQGLCADLLGINQILHDRPSDAQTVKRTRSTADFVQHDQRILGRTAQNMRHLIHFDHERGLSACQII